MEIIEILARCRAIYDRLLNNPRYNLTEDEELLMNKFKLIWDTGLSVSRLELLEASKMSINEFAYLGGYVLLQFEESA